MLANLKLLNVKLACVEELVMLAGLCLENILCNYKQRARSLPQPKLCAGSPVEVHHKTQHRNHCACGRLAAHQTPHWKIYIQQYIGPYF